MANQDTVFGARSVGHLMASNFNGAVQTYTVLATDAVAMFVGDFVKLTGTNGNGQDGFSWPVVTQAAATDITCGFVIGFVPDSDNLNRIYRPASTLRTVKVISDPYATFEIQASGTLAEADIGLNADITVGAGSTVTGLSGMEVDLSTKNTTTQQLRILGISNRPDNTFGADAKVICMINEQRFKGAVGV
jgi:hypothetical protein